MHVSNLTFVLFAVFSGVRIFSYIPRSSQGYRVWRPLSPHAQKERERGEGEKVPYAIALQIIRVIRDENGASAIAYSTWGMWTGANLSTGLYAIFNLNDIYLAAVSALYAVCCMAVIVITCAKRRVPCPGVGCAPRR